MQQTDKTKQMILANVNMILENKPTELRKEPVYNPVGTKGWYESGFKVTRKGKQEFVMITKYDSQGTADYSYVEIDGKKYTCDFDTRYIIYDKLHSIKEKEAIQPSNTIVR